MNWISKRISSFLEERPDRFKPEEANEMNLKRLEKIDFSGNMHIIENKPTKTDMILIKKGDLVISGINIEKGAVAVYTGEDNLLATIHYSSYEFDKNKINIEYFKWYLKSKNFHEVLLTQIKGGIKTELKAKNFLPLEILLPSIYHQEDILNKINEVMDEINDVTNSFNCIKGFIDKLRQSILQEAVWGKLTADWRKENPDVEPASELLKRIKAEKDKLVKEKKKKKQKPLPPITKDEIPFELPEGWEWCRLGEINIVNPRNDEDNNLDCSFIPMRLISEKFGYSPKYEIKKWIDIKSGFTHFAKNDVIIAKITPCFENSKAAVLKDLKNSFGAGTTELHVLRMIEILPEFIYIISKTNKFLEEGKKKMTGTAGQQRIPKSFIENYSIALPPFLEQQQIVEKVSKLMQLCDELENNIKPAKEYSEQLMEAVLREAFDEKNN
ncbi:hypothetical protein D4R71_06985 [bacterium]|nr:MAG: hypothetical protein D4R71_06985 [bacterium]